MRYRRKLSGPILDRIDLYADVHEIDNSKLLDQRDKTISNHTLAMERIARARNIQSKRFKNSSKLNVDMTNREIQLHAKQILDAAAEHFGLSPRAYHANRESLTHYRRPRQIIRNNHRAHRRGAAIPSARLPCGIMSPK
jgi:predicted ATPase with chaperone activity